MAKLTQEEVKYIGNLSRLELTKEETALYSEQLSAVLGYVEQLSEVDTNGVLPTANITGLKNIWSADKVLESGITHEEIAKNAPEFKNGSFVVPGVFE